MNNYKDDLLNFKDFEFKTIYKSDDFEIILPIKPKDKIKALQKKKSELRKWSRDIIDKYLYGEISDLSEFINLSR